MITKRVNKNLQFCEKKRDLGAQVIQTTGSVFRKNPKPEIHTLNILTAIKIEIANPLTKISIFTGRMDRKFFSQFMHRRYLLPTIRRIHHRRLSLQK